MGLEEDIVLDEDQKQQWDWMAQYRIWEANRKVFLFPENWLEPELRTSKSEFFEALENELLQDQISDENVERAITRYIEKVDAVSWLEILGTYHYKNTTDDKDVLHVIGRTRSYPHLYYYRKLEGGSWTAWEKLDLEIDSEFVMPIVVNGRLLLFWAKFRETAKEATRLYNEDPSLYDPLLHQMGYISDEEKSGYLESISDPFVTYDINIGMSEYKYDKWMPGKLSKESYKSSEFWPLLIFLTGGLNKTEIKDFRFYIGKNEDCNLVFINCYQQVSGQSATFDIDSDYSIEQIQFDLGTNTFTYRGPVDLDEYAIYDSTLIYNKYSISSGKDLVLYKDSERNDSVIVLDDPDYGFEIPIQSQYYKYYSQGSLFYQDDKRSYLVTPKETPIFSPNHNLYLTAKTTIEGDINLSTQMKYKFENFFHPYSSDLMKSLNLYGIGDVMKRDTQLWVSEYFDSYGPLAVLDPYPKNEVDFTLGSPYGMYNWEIFYHAPMLIANQLNQDQQFEEAQKWYHYIFNPLDRTGDVYDTPQHYWQFKPFFEEYDLDSINDLMYSLSYSGSDSDMLDKKEHVEAQIEAWKADPFEPHTIAALRKVSYMKSTVLKYIDNLLDWGDSLFKRDTIESINEATQLYILAYKLMGARPVEVPTSDRDSYTYNELLDVGIDAFSNALIELESLVVAGGESEVNATDVAMVPLYNLYFCIPHNKQLLTYWDTIEDRLFKIRNCMNIDGVKRSLALFEQPIDPGMLVNARAAGVDLGSVLSDLNAPLPNYRFQFYIAKAKEYARDIQVLGSALLSALEKKDAEALALLRSNQEMSLQSSIRELKKLYVTEANENLSAIKQSKVTVEKRYNYYKEIKKINAGENTQMAMVGSSTVLQLVSQGIKSTASATTILPDPNIGANGAFPVAIMSMPGGAKLSKGMEILSSGLDMAASILNSAASITGSLASYQRRWNDWKLQEKLANSELDQMDKQIAAAGIRVSLMEKDLTNFEKQMEQSVEYHEFMTGKYSNKELYQWMVSQLSSLYFQAYKLAYDCAKRAQKSFQYELSSEQTYVQYGYWDSLKKGLLAGEKLQHDLKRMEMAYYEQNRRQMEITKQVSIAMFDPLALLMLQQNGECYIELPECLFDVDYPGHYQRRLKTVSISLPCITGPYTSINGTLTLLENKYRKNTGTSGGYTEVEGNEDERFAYNLAAIQSVATSSGNNDSGLFQLNFQDERYLPFEGSGAVSSWRFKLPQKFRPFDYSTISDLIIHLNYTAKDGGEVFGSEVNDSIIDNLTSMALASGNTGLNRAFSIKDEFPNDWHRFLNPDDTPAEQTVSITFDKTMFPYLVRDRDIEINSLDIIFLVDGEGVTTLNIQKVSVAGSDQGLLELTVADQTLDGQLSGHLDLVSSEKLSDQATDMSLTFSALDISNLQPGQPDDIIVMLNYTI